MRSVQCSSTSSMPCSGYPCTSLKGVALVPKNRSLAFLWFDTLVVVLLFFNNFNCCSILFKSFRISCSSLGGSSVWNSCE